MAAATHAIVGATGAVGRALAQRVVKRGGVPLLIGRSADKLDALAKEHNNGGLDAVFLALHGAMVIEGEDVGGPADSRAPGARSVSPPGARSVSPPTRLLARAMAKHGAPC